VVGGLVAGLRRRGAARRGSLEGGLAVAAAASFAVLASFHLVYTAMVLGGTPSAATFRYYLPLWPILAHAAS
jgi:hypothetical protein